MTTKNAIVDFLLKEERALIPGLLFHPFRNALMKGATMDEQAVAYTRKLRWGAIHRSGKNKKPSPDLVQNCTDLVTEFVKEIKAKDIHITGSIGDGAIRAASKYGKTVGHDADLNFGDCFTYACAKSHSLRLIYKGNDFSKTDLA